MITFYDMEGKIIDFDTFMEMFGNDDYRRVAYNRFGDVEVSTVLLGLDVSEEVPPMIFETKIFGSSLDDTTWRYATKDDALVGHEQACSLILLQGSSC